jgi:hypothetical protein
MKSIAKVILGVPFLYILYSPPALADVTFFTHCTTAIRTPMNSGSGVEKCKVTHFENGNSMIQFQSGAAGFNFMTMMTTMQTKKNEMKIKLLGSRVVGNKVCYGSSGDEEEESLFEVCYIMP